MKKQLILTTAFASAVLSLGLYTSKAEAANIYRLYNVNTSEHLYTQNSYENNQLPQQSPSWLQEGIGWVAPDSGKTVYRVYNPNSGEHFYTLDSNEVKNLVSHGWRNEGVSFYSGGSIPVYRLYNPNAGIGAHHFTYNTGERDSLIKSGWRNEGIAFYASKGGSSNTSNNHTISNGINYYKGVLLVNKKHPLPSNYNPGENRDAGNAIRRMISDMRNSGLNISNSYSGFRSYSTQSKLYNNYVAQDGKAAADRYSARPGYSEHQTGLAFDLLNKSGGLVTSSREANWINNNAWKYGFIVRYPAGKESVTGYMQEQWHVRYVGSSNTAQAIKNSGKTLEEYLGAPGGGY